MTSPIGTKPRAIIIGGSMAGLFSALLLRKAGWCVDVYERVGAELASRGAGIVTHPDLWRIVAKAGVQAEPNELGVGVSGRVVIDSTGSICDALRLPQVLTSWRRLYALLREALPDETYHRGRSLEVVEQDTEGVTARFSGGSKESAMTYLGRCRRYPLHGARTVFADGKAALCRLCRVAWNHQRANSL